MKVHKGENSAERTILTGMIVNSSVCGCIAAKWRNDLFRNNYANLIAGWCVHYYEQYGKAPIRRIENLYHRWANKSRDRDIVSMVETFLEGLSDEYHRLRKEINPDFVLDTAKAHFREIRLEKLAESLQDDLAVGEVDKADHRVAEFTQVSVGQESAIKFPIDKERVLKCFDEAHEPIVVYPGDLGKFFGQWLERDGFLGFWAPEKRGKSFWLQDLAFRAMTQRRKVAYFEAGDMSENQLLRRWMVRISKRPMYPGMVKIPVALRAKRRKKKTIGVRIHFQIKKFQRGLDKKTAWKSCKKLMNETIKSKDHEYLRISCHPNNTLSVKMIETTIREWTHDGWCPDIVVVDYADIMDISKGPKEQRDKIDAQWMGLRRISQTFHCLVVTATQSNRESYDATIIRRKHTSEDKRKLAHVTMAVGINQTEDEKKKGTMRLNCIALREGEYLESRCVWIAGNLKLANPCMKSTF
jgi:hypothetical protein